MKKVGADWPMVRYLADDPVFAARYRALLKSFTADVFTEARMNALFDASTALVAPWAIGPAGEQPGYTHLANASAYTAALPSLKAHVRARRAVIAAFAP